MADPPDPAPDTAAWFGLFTEVGIIGQLSRAILERHLPDGLLADHYAVVNHLAAGRDGQTPLAIARAFQVPKTTITHRLSVLEAGGYLVLAPNPRDGRSKCVRLTPKGLLLRGEAARRAAGDLVAIEAGFDRAAVAEATALLRRLRMVMDAARDADPSP